MRHTTLLSFVFLLFAATCLAQPGKNLQPSQTKSLTVFQLRTYDKKPIPKARISVEATAGNLRYEGKTDADGNWQCLLPIKAAYWVNAGDSMHVGQVTIPDKPYSLTKHTTYFNGWIDGKQYVSERPLFNMMPPADGQAVIGFEFDGLQGQPLVGEEVKMVADGTKKEYVSKTDAEGKTQIRVLIGENYTVVMPYNANFDHINFPAHGGSYNAQVHYVYAGKAAIEQMRVDRLASQTAYDAYKNLSREEQRKIRDEEGHKKVFRAIPIKKETAPFTVEKTNYGFDLKARSNAPVVTPCYVDGMIVAGAGWDSDELGAVDAETGQSKWAISLEESGISNVEGGDGVVVCATESCTIYAIAAGTGELLWSKWLADYVLSAPCVADGRVYIGYEDTDGAQVTGDAEKPYSMACFDLHSGEIIWQQWIRGEVMSSAVASDNYLVFNTFSGHSYVLDRKDGKIVAEKQLFGTSAPIMADGMVFMAQRDGGSNVARERIAAFDPATLELKKSTAWQTALYLDAEAQRKTKFASTADQISLNTGGTGEPIATSGNVGPRELVGSTSIFSTQSHEGSRPLYLGGKIYVSQGHVLRCLDAKTLTQAWEWNYPSTLTDDGGTQIAPPIAVGGKVVVACMDGALRVFDPANGRILTSYVTGRNHRQQPIAIKGNFYAPCTDGRLAVIQTKDKTIDGWPCWGGNMARTNSRGN